MFNQELLLDFNEGFNEIKRKTSNLLDEANQMIMLCAQTLNNLKKSVSANEFENKDAEILFFKTIKLIPMQYLIYYTEVRTIELLMPKIGQHQQMTFLEKQVKKVNAFFSKHIEFLIYVDQGYEHFDKLYFTRKHVYDATLLKTYPYYKDPMFNTSRDGILAKIKGLGLFANYLKEKKWELENSTLIYNSENVKSNINWTGSYAAFIEMVYGCAVMDYFNDGNVDINKVIEALGTFLNVPKGNSTRTYNELKNRKHSRIKFFEESGQKLLDKMDKEDSLTDNQ